MQIRKNQNIINNNETTIMSEDENTWQRSQSPEKDKEKESKMTPKNNQNGESCQPETKYEKDQQDPDNNNGNNYSSRITIGNRSRS